MENVSLKKVQKIQYFLLKEVDKICSSQRISYFLVAGTTLGAIRHNGFIPWDDDLDIGMNRNDYEKFKLYMKNNPSDNYFFQDADFDENYGNIFGKLRKKKTTYTENAAKDSGAKDGIYIDIFCFDNAPDNLVKRKYQKYLIYFYKRLLLVKNNYYIVKEGDSLYKKAIYFLLMIFSKALKRKQILNRIKFISQKYNSFNTSHKVNLGGAYSYDRELIPSYYIDNLELHKFEDSNFPIFCNYDLYLTNLYGDYMVPTPLSERENRHGIIEIKL